MTARHPRWAPALFVAPFLLAFGVLFAYPLLRSTVLAMQQTYGPGSSTFVGLLNFRDLWADPRFFTALRNTFVYAAASVAIQLPLALVLALVLDRPGLRGRALYRLVFFSPSLVGVAFAALIFLPILDKNTGLLNVALHGAVGFDLEFAWLEEHALLALVVASLWMYVGFDMVFFLAALQSVDRSLVDAARIDGAGAWSRFVHVTWPAIRPVSGFVVLVSVIGSFQLFELPWILLDGKAGPDDSALTIVMYLYQVGFETGDLGYASAIGWSLALLLVGFALVQRRLFARSED